MADPVITKDYVKKSSLLIACFVSALIGFLGGVVLSVYKSRSVMPLPAASPTQMPAARPAISEERAGQIEALKRETTQNPGNVTAWIELGNHYFDTDQFDQSIQAYEKALELDPNNADVWTDLGVMWRRKGNPQKAIAAFDKAMTIDPRHEVSRYNKGIVLMHDLNDSRGAVAVWEDLVRINPMAKSGSGVLIKNMVEKLRKDGK